MNKTQDVKSAKDISSSSSSTSYLVVGGTGGGKTSLLTTIPGRKFAYLFDPNAVRTIRGQPIDYIEFLPEHIDLDAVTLKRETRDRYTRAPEPMTYVRFEEDIEERIADGTFSDYDAIAIDSITTLTDVVMDRIMYLNGRFGKWPEQADYTATVNTILKIFRTVLSLGKVIYVTGHVEFKQEEASGKMLNTLAMVGRLRQRLPLAFAEIWLAFADNDKDGKTHWFVQTQPDRYNPWLRSTMRELDRIEDVTIDDWGHPEKFGIGALISKAR